ncbi:cell wall hydrolase [Parasphingopyxis marina]|uniref:Cell wall hydrolase n=1 Tax=Parasphingopyxis marina TaxID=2761622 RepID=A0A842HZC1_9SPHN|nr:cell wall hydrolase [Parasphingopyxis marina]MBC2776834.1 cell wall hydrolase [Parasphingopyxis marina]
MSLGHKNVIFGLSAAAAVTVAAVPMATGFAFESNDAIQDEADTSLLAESGIERNATGPEAATTEPTIALDQAAEFLAIEDELPAADETPAMDETVDADLICLVKIVRHEAANQSQTGQLAVAQLVMNRVRSPRFPNSICSVAHQRGQFFNTNAYNPSRSDALWQSALEVSLDARNQISDPVIGEAVFYHAAYAPSRFHASRPRVAQIGDHIFYR